MPVPRQSIQMKATNEIGSWMVGTLLNNNLLLLAIRDLESVERIGVTSWTMPRMKNQLVALCGTYERRDTYKVVCTSKNSFYPIKCLDLQNSQMWRARPSPPCRR